MSVVTTHRTWGFGGDGRVASWIVINISQCTCVTWSRFMVCIHIILSVVGSPPSDTCLRFLCGASPQECAQATDDSNLDPALSTRALSLHFRD